MYFLYAPFCVLAAFVAALSGLCLGAYSRPPRWPTPSWERAFSSLSYKWFGFIPISKHTSISWWTGNAGLLGDQYPLEYWGTSYVDGLRWLTETYPDSLISVWGNSRPNHGHNPRNRAFLPESARQKIVLKGEGETIGDFYITNHFGNYPLQK